MRFDLCQWGNLMSCSQRETASSLAYECGVGNRVSRLNQHATKGDMGRACFEVFDENFRSFGDANVLKTHGG